jgi:cysteine desulfurase/selenocysteine lyase
METITLKEYQAEFKDREGIHFNNAGLAPTCNRAAMRAAQVITELNLRGSFNDRDYLGKLPAIRERIARFLGADTSEVSYVPNCATGLSQIAFGMKLASSDSVVTIDQEYASNFYPWKVACERAGAKLVVFQSDENKQVNLPRFLELIKPGVKCVAVSWVQFQTGAMIDLKTLGEHCHSVGARLVVDGIQGIGQLPISFRDLPVDAIVGASHKWLCSLNGQGFLITKKDWLAELKPLAVGSGTFNRFGNFADLSAPMEASAKKFEAGGISYVNLFALDEAIALQEAVGIEMIAAEISRLSSIFRTGLRTLESRGLRLVTPLAQAGGTTSFILPLETEARFLTICQNEEVMIIKRGEFLRAAIHAFNSEQEVEKVLELIQRALG